MQVFTEQFERGALDEKIAQAVAGATVPEGYTVMGAVSPSAATSLPASR